MTFEDLTRYRSANKGRIELESWFFEIEPPAPDGNEPCRGRPGPPRRNRTILGLPVNTLPARQERSNRLAGRSLTPSLRQCPIELRGEAFPILVYGREVPRLTGIAYALTEFAVERFQQGGVCLGSELAHRTTSTSDRPVRVLTRKLKEPEFEPLARVLIYEPKKGGTLRIIDPGPES